jgi:hypothetical protein
MNSLLFYTIVMALCFQQEQAIDLHDLRWSFRIICIEAKEKSLTEQQITEIYKNKKDIDERKLKIFAKINNEYFEGYPLKKIPDVKNFPVNKINHYFSITVIGLDGGVKGLWQRLIKPTEVYNLIDTMPMRITEMRNGK